MSVANLAKALCQAQGEVGGVQKGSRNDHQNFHYTSIEQMVVATRGPLRRAGLVVIPTAHRIEGESLVTEWLLLHESGESMPLRYDMPIVPGKGRPMDKAASASASQALNYLLRDLLLLPRGEREDVDGRDDSGYEHGRRAAAPQASAGAVFARLQAKMRADGIDIDQLKAWHSTADGAPAWPCDDSTAQAFGAWFFNGEGGPRFSGWLQQGAA